MGLLYTLLNVIREMFSFYPVWFTFLFCVALLVLKSSINFLNISH